MDNPRPEKVAVVDEVRARLTEADAVLMTEYRGLNVTALADLRRQLRDKGAEYKVYKNTLVRLATREVVAGGLDELPWAPSRSPSSRATPRRWQRLSATTPGPTRTWCSRAASSASG
jgi:hypothetical protein